MKVDCVLMREEFKGLDVKGLCSFCREPAVVDLADFVFFHVFHGLYDRADGVLASKNLKSVPSNGILPFDTMIKQEKRWPFTGGKILDRIDMIKIQLIKIIYHNPGPDLTWKGLNSISSVSEISVPTTYIR